MVIEMDLLPPRWVDVQEEVSELLSEIAQNSAQLDKLHQKHLLPGFGDEDLRRQDEGVIERLTQDVTRSFHDCQRAIMRIETMVGESKAHGGVTSGEETMAKNIQISLAARVQEASARFRKKQSTYLRSMGPFFLFVFFFLFSSRGGRIGRFKYANVLICFGAELRDLEGIATPFDGTPTQAQNPYTDPSMMESDADRSFSQTMLQQTSQRQTGQNDAAIAQREREINDIAKGIIELSDIFRELQSMIIDQGTMLDRIDYNVERMGTEVKAADKELKVVCCSNFYSPSRLLLDVANEKLTHIGYELSTTNHQAQGHAITPPGRGGNDHCTGCETKGKQFSTATTSRGRIFKQYPLCVGLQGAKASVVEPLRARSVDGSGYIPMTFLFANSIGS